MPTLNKNGGKFFSFFDRSCRFGVGMCEKDLSPLNCSPFVWNTKGGDRVLIAGDLFRFATHLGDLAAEQIQQAHVGHVSTTWVFCGAKFDQRVDYSNFGVSDNHMQLLPKQERDLNGRRIKDKDKRWETGRPAIVLSMINYQRHFKGPEEKQSFVKIFAPEYTYIYPKEIDFTIVSQSRTNIFDKMVSVEEWLTCELPFCRKMASAYLTQTGSSG